MMKPAMSRPVISVLLVFAAISALDAVCGNPLDSTSNLIRPGVPYYIMPADPGNGGGISPYSLKINTSQVSCPLDLIFQSPSTSYKGVPVIFSPQNSSLDVVQLSRNLNIHFSSDIWFCPESKVWTAKFSAWHRGRVVTTGGTLRGSDSWFRIERDGDAYKLVYSSGSSSLWEDVGINVFRELRRDLVLSNRPVTVKFYRASLTDPTEKAMLRMFPSY